MCNSERPKSGEIFIWFQLSRKKFPVFVSKAEYRLFRKMIDFNWTQTRLNSDIQIFTIYISWYVTAINVVMELRILMPLLFREKRQQFFL